MKDTKRNTMKRNTLSILLITLLALGVMQASAVDYRNSYRGIQNTEYRAQTISVTAPAATFQSTSAYASSEWAENPMLNSDGTINEEAYMGAADAPSGPRRVGGHSGTPGQEGDKQPLGDALIPLFLLAMAYCGWRFLRRRKEA